MPKERFILVHMERQKRLKGFIKIVVGVFIEKKYLDHFSYIVK